MNLREKVNEIKFEMLNGLTYEEAEEKMKPFLEKANQRGLEIAKEYGQKYKKLTFNYIMR